MKLNWGELEKGTKLHILVPYVDNNGFIQYNYQESEVICVKPYKNSEISFVNVRFKYTDEHGKRKRVNCKIYDLNKSLVEYPYTGSEFGKIIIAYENKELLENKYKEMIDNEIQKCKDKQQQLNNYIRRLERMQYEKF